ncbi:MAG: hypothetical protein KatS3mg053_2141 [Candidatus Roseilinea sp.]|nr:MAG: hypothetical protein KatS3mg053_2141 [Candidatus Roseilinea sp.]
MSVSNERPSRLSRRQLLRGAVLTAGAGLLAAYAAPASPAAPAAPAAEATPPRPQPPHPLQATRSLARKATR